jgi:putative phosphoesterase
VRIAVIADTHDRLPTHVLHAIAETDEIWHLGDVCSTAIEDRLVATGRPVRIVHGNCDDHPGWPPTLDFELEGFRIRLIHIPPRVAPPGVQLLFHGHTHVPRNELVGHTRFYNPGCVTRPNRGAPASYAWLELRRGAEPSWRLALV